MRPNQKANLVLKTTRSLAKMIEFGVPPEYRQLRAEPPENLFTLVIGILGDLSERIVGLFKVGEPISIDEENARFCAIFFDSYKNACRIKELDNYYLIVGSVAYYFSNLPGSASVLLNAIDRSFFDLESQKIELLLFWIIEGKYTSVGNFGGSFYCDELMSIATEMQLFFRDGSEESEKMVYKNCERLREKVLREGTPRELLFGNFVFSIAILKIWNSSWKKLPYFSGLSKEVWQSTIKRDSFIKELWPSQLQLGEENAFKGQSSVIQMPTSAGKTKSTELIIRSAFLSKRTDIAVIVAPFRALCHEIRNDLFKCFRGERDVVIDDINDAFISEDVPFFEDEKKHLIVLTPEKFYYLLTQQKEFVSKIGLVVYDEGHQFDSGKRGVMYELLLTELKLMLPSNVQIVLISAVISNAGDVAQWLASTCKVIGGKIKMPTQRSMAYVEGTSLSFFKGLNVDNFDFYAPKIVNKIELPLIGKETKIRSFPDLSDAFSVALYLALLKTQSNCVAIFLGTKRSVKPLLEKIVDYYRRMPKEKKPPFDAFEKKRMLNLIRGNFGEDNLLYKSVWLGILTHHADIPQGIRLCVENEIYEGLSNFLICTSTLAQGVNLPIKYLLIPSIWMGKTKIRVRDFHNLIGRVARAGKMTEGSIIFTDTKIASDFWKKKDVNQLINSDNSEGCVSSLLELLDDDILSVYDVKGKRIYRYRFTIDAWVDAFGRNVPILEITNKICEDQKVDDASVKDEFKQIVTRIYGYLECLENFMLNRGEALHDLDAAELAKSTFAYNLTNDLGKEKLIFVFSSLKKRIENLGIDPLKMKAMSKTLGGLNRSLELDTFLQQNRDLIEKVDSCEDFIKIIFPLFSEKFFSKKAFFAYPNKKRLFDAVCCWIKGNSYEYLYGILKGEKIGKFDFSMEMCVEVFDGCLSFDGSVLINAVLELLLNLSPDLQKKIEWFQKQIKYGLPSKESIIIYEIGFCDRMLAQRLAVLFKGIENRKDMIIQLLLEDDNVKNVLKDYPLYFEKNVYERLSY